MTNIDNVPEAIWPFRSDPLPVDMDTLIRRYFYLRRSNDMIPADAWYFAKSSPQTVDEMMRANS